MTLTCEAVAEAISSGDPNHVNPLIDEIGDLTPDDRLLLFDECFEQCLSLYDNEESDGYQRQSAVRVVDAFKLPLGLTAFVMSDGAQFAADVTCHDLREGTERVEAFFLEALQDRDGRVRQAAQRGLDTVCTGYNMIGEEDLLRSVIAELNGLANEHSGTTEEHIQEAHDQAAVHVESRMDHLLSGLQNEIERSQNRPHDQ